MVTSLLHSTLHRSVKQVIGMNEVAVPTHLFKIVLCQRGRQQLKEHRRDEDRQKGKENVALNDLANPRAASPNYVSGRRTIRREEERKGGREGGRKKRREEERE